MADIVANNRGYAHDFDPHRSSPPLPPVPDNSFEGPTSVFVSGSDTDSSDSHISPSIRVLAEMYNFPCCPSLTTIPPRLRPKRSIYATNNFPPEPVESQSRAGRTALMRGNRLYSLSAPMDLSKVDPDQLEKSTVASPPPLAIYSLDAD